MRSIENFSLQPDGWIEGRKDLLICRRKKGMLVGGGSIFLETSLASIWGCMWCGHFFFFS